MKQNRKTCYREYILLDFLERLQQLTDKVPVRIKALFLIGIRFGLVALFIFQPKYRWWAFFGLIGFSLWNNRGYLQSMMNSIKIEWRIQNDRRRNERAYAGFRRIFG
jgi:hypothetical protein